MKLPRFSMRAVMFLVAVAAVDCVTVQEVSPSLFLLSNQTRYVAMVGLPMANVLALGLLLLAKNRGRSRAFWAGFETFGAVGFFGCLGFAIGWTYEIQEIHVDILEFSLQWLDLPDNQIGEILGLAVDFLLFSIPQVLIALIGGVLFAACHQKFRERSGPETASVGKLPIRWFALAILIVAIPYLTNEAIHRWDIDPRIGRISPGTKAEIVTVAGWLVYGLRPDGLEIDVALGSRVEVQSDDDSPDLIGLYQSDNADGRKVRVKLLEGPEAGEFVDIPRWHLRPRSIRSRATYP